MQPETAPAASAQEQAEPAAEAPHPRRRRSAVRQAETEPAAAAGPANPVTAVLPTAEPVTAVVPTAEPAAAVFPEQKQARVSVAETEPARAVIPEEYYPSNRCCICGHPLDTGHAVLFSDERGFARIDENCCKGLEIAARSTDRAEVARAFDFFASWIPYVKQPVADYLRNYLRVVQTFLNA